MFGYVVPLKCELKVKELTMYNAYYCGLCKCIQSHFGELPRVALSYDCTFLALLLSGLNGVSCCQTRRCGYKPLKSKQPVAEDSISLRFAADIDLLLAYHKCEDDWQDEKKVKALFGKMGLCAAAKRAGEEQPDAARSIREGLSALSGLEKQNCAELDLPANTFAEIMRGIFAAAPLEDETARAPLLQMGLHLGRWIYLIDAWDDREKDAKSGSYNPFLASGADWERASFLLHLSLNEAGKAFDLLPLREDSLIRGILENIIHCGCAHKTESLLKGEQNESL